MVKTSKLSKAQSTLWSMLSKSEKEQHIATYKQAKTNLENGITRTVVDHVKVENNAPAALYFAKDESLEHQVNIVGQVFHALNGDAVVFFESKDLITLLELYYGNNILSV